jgi:hypothetical protein
LVDKEDRVGFPTHFDIRPLDILDNKNYLNLLLGRVFTGHGLFTDPAGSLLFNLSRLIDKAIDEYEHMRTELEAYEDSGGNSISRYAKAVSHLETCINALNRAMKYAEALRRDKQTPWIEKPALPTDRQRQRLSMLRAAIEHTDERIICANERHIQIGEPISLVILEDGCELGGCTIRFEELARWIQQVHDVTKRLNACKPSPGAAVRLSGSV